MMVSQTVVTSLHGFFLSILGEREVKYALNSGQAICDTRKGEYLTVKDAHYLIPPSFFPQSGCSQNPNLSSVSHRMTTTEFRHSSCGTHR